MKEEHRSRVKTSTMRMGVMHIGQPLTVHGRDTVCASSTETWMPAWHQSHIRTLLKQTDFTSVRRGRRVGGSRDQRCADADILASASAIVGFRQQPSVDVRRRAAPHCQMSVTVVRGVLVGGVVSRVRLVIAVILYRHISTKNHPISMAFGGQMQIWNLVTNVKILKFKLADGPHFKNRFLAITQQPIVRFR